MYLTSIKQNYYLICQISFKKTAERFLDPYWPLKSLQEVASGVAKLLYFQAKLSGEFIISPIYPEYLIKDLRKIYGILKTIYNLPPTEKVKLLVGGAYDLSGQKLVWAPISAGVSRTAKIAKEVRAAQQMAKAESAMKDAAKLAQIKNIEQAAANEIKLIEALEKANAPSALTNAKHAAEFNKLTQTLLQRMIQKEQEFLKAYAGLPRTLEYVREELAMRVARLEIQFGKETVQEALSLFNTSDTKLVKNIRTCERLEETVQKLQKINSNPKWANWKIDPKKGLNLTSIDEAIAAIACEERNILKNLERAAHEAEDFVQSIGNRMAAWDIKTPHMFSIEGKYVFNAEEFTQNIIRVLTNNPKEHIILDVMYLPNHEAGELYTNIMSQLSEEMLKRILLIDSRDPVRAIGNLI